MMPVKAVCLKILDGRFAEVDHITATEKSNRLAFAKKNARPLRPRLTRDGRTAV